MNVATPTTNRADAIRARIAALTSDIRRAEAKAARIAVSIETRRKTLARLRTQLGEIESGQAHAEHEHR